MDVPAVAQCQECGIFLCESCRWEADGKSICVECVAAYYMMNGYQFRRVDGKMEGWRVRKWWETGFLGRSIRILGVMSLLLWAADILWRVERLSVPWSPIFSIYFLLLGVTLIKVSGKVIMGSKNLTIRELDEKFPQQRSTN